MLIYNSTTRIERELEKGEIFIDSNMVSRIRKASDQGHIPFFVCDLWKIDSSKFKVIYIKNERKP